MVVFREEEHGVSVGVLPFGVPIEERPSLSLSFPFSLSLSLSPFSPSPAPRLRLLERALELLGRGRSPTDVRRRPLGGALHGSGVSVWRRRWHHSTTSGDARPAAVSRGLPRRELDLDLEPSERSLRQQRGGGCCGHRGSSSRGNAVGAAAAATVDESSVVAAVTSSSAFLAGRHRARPRS